MGALDGVVSIKYQTGAPARLVWVPLHTCPHMHCLKTIQKQEGRQKGEVRHSLASEEPISRGNKEKRPSSGLIQTHSAGSSEKCFGLGQGKGRGGASTLGFEVTTCRARHTS